MFYRTTTSSPETISSTNTKIGFFILKDHYKSFQTVDVWSIFGHWSTPKISCDISLEKLNLISQPWMSNLFWCKMGTIKTVSVV